jgi:hypothetical protein
MKFLVVEDLEHLIIQKLNNIKTMKLLGFIKEYNNIKDAVNLDIWLNEKSSINTDSEKILQYLDQGVLLLSWMGYFTDVKTKELIAPDSYYTDGVWVWPSYLPYYLKKDSSLVIDKEFIEYLKNRNFNFKVSDNFDELKMQLEKELSNKLAEGN